MVGIEAGMASSAGRVRATNQDSGLIRPRLFAVADGMGGLAAGERASALAVTALAELPEEFTSAQLLRAIRQANAAIVAESRRLDDPRGMGTTLTGVAVVKHQGGDHWLVFNIGDSRVYVVDRGHLVQVTVDHSEVQRLVEAGRLRPDEAAGHPLGNVVTRSLGRSARPTPDHWYIAYSSGHTFLACSDGVPLEIPHARLLELLTSEGSAQQVAERIVAAADAAGGRDNATAVVVRS